MPSESLQFGAKKWLLIAFVAIGVVVGYLNFRFGLRGIFVMTNEEGLRTLLILLGGYLSLLPLTLFGIWFRHISSILLLIGTMFACFAGLKYMEAQSILFVIVHFVWPNLIVAILMWLSASPKVETSIART